MWRGFSRLIMAVALLVVLWGLTLVREAPDQVWVHPLSPQPRPVRILRFYATAGTLLPGQSARLCYSVENAKSIRIAPDVAQLYPSWGRCLDVQPDHTTHYTLQAEGFDGRVAFRSVTLSVQDQPIAPMQPLQVAWVR
jgi:hypothetical protein